MKRVAGRSNGAAVLETQRDLTQALEGMKGALDALDINLFVADRDLRLVYMNPRAAGVMRTMGPAVEKQFGVAFDQWMGTTIDALPGVRAAEIRRLLSDPANLPVRTEIQFGEWIFDLHVSAILARSGEYLGVAVNWEEISAARNLEQEVNTVRQMVENSPCNMMQADRDLIIRYINRSSLETLKTLEHLLPCKAEEVAGKSIDIFHKNPERQRRLLSDPKNLPHRAVIQLGGELLDLLVSPIYDSRGNYQGPMLTWEVVTEKKRVEREAARAQSMMENMPINIMYAGTDLKLAYMNPLP